MIDPKIQAALLAEYERESGLYEDFAATTDSLLGRMLEDAGIQLHSITNRCKNRKSLEAKLAKPDKGYAALADITDIAAVRVTTYFADDVDRVAKVVEEEFTIDAANSIDKRKLLDPDRFGYQSLHYVASYSAERRALVEYARFGGRRLEIQVRSILQHAWAEIEHDLGYKSAAGVPRETRRRFSRIAGLLELADDEFSAIRKDLEAYAATVSQEIKEQPENVGIDKISLQALVSSSSSALHRISQAVGRAAGARVERTGADFLERAVGFLGFVNVTTVAQLEQVAASHFAVVEAFARLWLGTNRFKDLDAAIGVLYLAYVLLAERGDEEQIRDFLKFGKFEHSVEKNVERIRTTYKAALASL